MFLKNRLLLMNLLLNNECKSVAFISDLHLDNKKENQLFFNFIKSIPKDAEYLFILGDLFDYWVGDDNDMYLKEEQALCELSKQLHLFFLPGNRDFLIGKKFLKKTNITFLEDEVILSINGEKILLMHGDTLCSDDIDYQNFRKLVRSKNWQNKFLQKALNERLKIANNLRVESKKLNLNKAENIIDINLGTLINTVKKYNFVPNVIHGHTHRKKIHEHAIGDFNFQRYVLGDWSDLSGNYLLWEKNNGFKFHDF